MKNSDGTIASPDQKYPILPSPRTVAVLVQLAIYGPKLSICEASLHLVGDDARPGETHQNAPNKIKTNGQLGSWFMMV